MSTQHTPGPWGWYWRNEDGKANCGVFWQERKGMAYSVCRAPSYETQEQWEANAHLIAAAPELLEALVALMPDAEANDFGGPDTGARLAAARAAIAKATGEQA